MTFDIMDEIEENPEFKRVYEEAIQVFRERFAPCPEVSARVELEADNCWEKDGEVCWKPTQGGRDIILQYVTIRFTPKKDLESSALASVLPERAWTFHSPHVRMWSRYDVDLEINHLHYFKTILEFIRNGDLSQGEQMPWGEIEYLQRPDEVFEDDDDEEEETDKEENDEDGNED